MSRRGWDDRGSPEAEDHKYKNRKRKSDEDRREHRDSYSSKRYRDRHDDDRRDRNRDDDDRRDRYRDDDDRRDRYRDDDDRRDRYRDDDDRRDRYRDDDDRRDRNRDDFPRKRSRFEQGSQGFVKKREASPEWGKANVKEEPKATQEKEKPNFQTSGKLTEERNMVNGIVIKYSEPAEARQPKRRWRLYPFKGEKSLPVLYIHKQSAYLLGRDRKIADIPLDHPSCSKQHAALQYRLVPYQKENGTTGRHVRPYLIDLESANGTFVNDVKLEPKRYHELLERDVLKFGFSSREYVVLHEQSKNDEQDDNVNET